MMKDLPENKGEMCIANMTMAELHEFLDKKIYLTDEYLDKYHPKVTKRKRIRMRKR